jgi:hypothetical protein
VNRTRRLGATPRGVFCSLDGAVRTIAAHGAAIRALVLVGLGFAALPQVGSDEFFSLSTYLSDLPASAPFGLALTLGAEA